MKFLGHELTEESCHLLDRLERPTDVTEYASKDRLILLYVNGLVVRVYVTHAAEGGYAEIRAQGVSVEDVETKARAVIRSLNQATT